MRDDCVIMSVSFLNYVSKNITTRFSQYNLHMVIAIFYKHYIDLNQGECFVIVEIYLFHIIAKDSVQVRWIIVVVLHIDIAHLQNAIFTKQNQRM